tara:strand:- start:1462 stop:2097 length:636 start_codon:yes stop_codon:yes gene_type:complete
MTFSYHLFLQELTGLKITSAVVSVLLSAQVLAVQPMSESDLEVVSATTGSNILNIFGASQAGLKVDGYDSEDKVSSPAKLEAESFDEGEATKPIALNALRAIEDDNFHTPNNKDLAISKASQFTILKINEQTTGSTSLFTTSSEINYKTSNVHHEMREIRNGGVAVSRDLQIDSLKIENLRGNYLDESRSAGSIYISDWRSQGDTRINTSK